MCLADSLAKLMMAGIPKWNKFLYTYMEMWKSRLINWVLNSTNDHPVHIVRYEDLQKNRPGELAKLLTFLKIPYSDKDLLLSLHDDFKTFKRQHINDHFEHYSRSQKEHIQYVLLDTIKLVRAANKTHLLKLEEYLPD